jgi:pimeloyl-ACP methyl ester carboxylesterase
MAVRGAELTGTEILTVVLAALSLTACVSVQPLEQARSDFSDQLTRAGEHLVYADQSGRGDPLVLIHGFGASSYSWRKVIPELAEHHRVVAVDLFGFGWTDRPPDRQHYSRDGQVGLVLGVMDALGIDAAHIVGHSYGGAVSMALAADHPERVRSMVLVDSAAVDYPLMRRRWFAHSRVLSWMFVRGLALRTGVARRALERAYYDDSQVTDELIEAYLERLRVEGVAGAYRSLSWPLPASQRPRQILYQELAVPTLVLWGVQDQLISAQVGRYYAELLPDSRFVAIEGAGHSPMEEKPAEFLKEVIRFLAEIEKRSTSTPTTASHGAM